MKKTGDRWYVYGENSEKFYSTTPKTKREYFYVGDGSKLPSPKDLHEYLSKLREESDLDRFANNNGVYSYDKVDESSVTELPPGTYFFMPESYPLPERLVPVTFRSDEYVKMPRLTMSLGQDIKDFLSSESIYRKLKSIYKMGIMVYGPPGEGKTSFIRSVVRDELPPDAVVITINAVIPSVQFINSMKNTLDNRLKIFILEEFTHFTKESTDMEDILTFTDGENSIDRSIIIATTNYPELLPGNIVERPSRFDTLYKVSSPNREERALLMAHYLMRAPTDAEVDAAHDLSSASIKEICLLTHKKGLTVIDAIVQLRKQLKLAKSEFRESERIGL